MVASPRLVGCCPMGACGLPAASDVFHRAARHSNAFTLKLAAYLPGPLHPGVDCHPPNPGGQLASADCEPSLGPARPPERHPIGTISRSIRKRCHHGSCRVLRLVLPLTLTRSTIPLARRAHFKVLSAVFARSHRTNHTQGDYSRRLLKAISFRKLSRPGFARDSISPNSYWMVPCLLGGFCD